MRHWRLIRTECCPALSPFSASKLLPGGKRRSVSSIAASSAVSIAVVRLAKSDGNPFPNDPATVRSANLPFTFCITTCVYHDMIHNTRLVSSKAGKWATKPATYWAKFKALDLPKHLFYINNFKMTRSVWGHHFPDLADGVTL